MLSNVGFYAPGMIPDLPRRCGATSLSFYQAPAGLLFSPSPQHPPPTSERSPSSFGPFLNHPPLPTVQARAHTIPPSFELISSRPDAKLTINLLKLEITINRLDNSSVHVHGVAHLCIYENESVSSHVSLPSSLALKNLEAPISC